MFDNIFRDLPALETERLVLRKLYYSDSKDIFSYAKNPNVSKHVLWEAHKDEFDSVLFLDLINNSYKQNKAAPWGIEFKETKKIIGTAGFVYFDEEKQEAEIGYALSERYWRRGIVSESLREILKFGFERMGLKKIHARCKPENIASYRILEKLKFKYDGLSKKNIMIKGKLEDMKIYSITADKYFDNQSII